MKKFQLLFVVLLAAIPFLSAQELENPGVFVIHNEEVKDDFFGEAFIARGTASKIVFIIDPSLLAQINADVLAGWIKRRELMFVSDFVTPRLQEVETGTAQFKGESATYVSVIADARGFGGVTNVSAKFNLNPDGKNWTTDNTVQVSVTARKVTYLRVQLVSQPIFKVQTTTLNIKIEGSQASTVTLERIDGNDVVKGDQEVAPKIIRNVITGSFIQPNLISGTYNLTVEQPGFAPFRQPNVFFPPDAPVNLTATLVQEKITVNYSVSDKSGKAITDFDLIVQTKEGVDAGSQLGLFNASGTIELAPGSYTIRARKNNFAMQPVDLNVTAGGIAPRVALVLTSAGTQSGVAAKPVPVTVNALDQKKGSKLTKFNIRIVKADGTDTQDYPLSNSGKKISLMPGAYTVSITKDGYSSGTQSIELVAGQRSREVNILLEKNAKVKIITKKTSGGWGWLFIVASAGAAGYYLVTNGDTYGTPPALPTN